MKEGGEGGKSWIWGEITWWEAEWEGEGGRYTDRQRESRERTEGRGVSWRSLVQAGACSGPLQANTQNRKTFFFFFYFFFFSSSTVREKPQASQKNFTAGHKPVRGSSPEMNRGDSLRRRLSSLRGTWRWSTGYLFRKVGCDRGAHGWTVGMDVDCSFTVSSLVFFPPLLWSSLSGLLLRL